MADQVRAPVAIRVMRPYSSEDAFLERELETLTRTSIILVGAQSRPVGVVLRFEVVLENGTSIMRGEGRVVSHKPNAFNDQPGLTLRFTRLDTRTKALVDKAATLRDEKTRAALGSAAPASPSKPPPAVSVPQNKIPQNIPVHLTPPPKPVAVAAQAVTPVAIASVKPPPGQPSAPPVAVPPPEPSDPILVASTGEMPAMTPERAAAIANREDVLDRLRARRKNLTDARMTEILALKRR
jgi:hypothetical protein